MVVTLRCLVVWLVTTAVAATTGWWSLAGGGALEDLSALDTVGRFDRLVVAAAGVTLALCAVWAWLVCTVVIGQVVVRLPGAPRRRPSGVPGVPAWAVRIVLAACGLAVLTVGPAHASYDAPAVPTAGAPTWLLDGLPFPDRAPGPAHAPDRTGPAGRAGRPPGSPRAASPAPGPDVVVEPGDSLWRIAADRLPDDASVAEIARATAALADLNREVVGTDPDLIHPGLRLRLPDA